MQKDLARFTSRLEVTPLSNGRDWRTLRTFGYDVGHKDSGVTIVIPAGFVTDFASIPWPLWSFIGGSWGRYGKAAVVHDWLYQHQYYLDYRGNTYGTHTNITRKEADDIFLEAMVVLKVAPWRRRLMYWGVRMWGWLAWRRR